jgi:hypothetical protein
VRTPGIRRSHRVGRGQWQGGRSRPWSRNTTALDREGHHAKEIERNRDVLERTRLAVDRGQPFESKPWR